MNNDKEINNSKYNFNKRTRKYGLIGGLAMAAYLALLQLTGTADSTMLKMVKYIPFAILLYVGLKRYKMYLPKGKLFFKGLGFGTVVSAYSAIITAASMTFLYAAHPEGVEITKFQSSVTNMLQMLVVDGMLILEIFVFGMITTFICLQGLKENPRQEFVQESA